MKDRPNILFFFPDQWRYDWLEGIVPIRTPNLMRLARMGIRFDRAITPSPLCAPARACLAAGMEYERCRTPDNNANFPLDQPTFYRALRDAGYHVMGCGKFDLAKALHDWELSGKRRLDEWGFSDGIDSEGKWDAVNSGRETPKGPYMAFLEARGLREIHVRDFDRRCREGKSATFPTPLPDDAYGDNWVARNGLELLDRAPSDRPWFLQINFPGPHAPWDITPSMEASCRELRDLPPPVDNDQFPQEHHLRIRQNYSATVENIDRWIGLYLERLEAACELDSTLVVFSSDHGEMLGDHGRWGKGVSYQPSIGVPLIIMGPGVRAGVRIDAPTTILDLAATFLDFGGARELSDADSRSLRPLLEGRAAAPRRVVRSGLHEWRAVLDGRWKLVARLDADARPPGWKPTALFDLAGDPQETQNVLAVYPSEARRLREKLPPC